MLYSAVEDGHHITIDLSSGTAPPWWKGPVKVLMIPVDGTTDGFTTGVGLVFDDGETRKPIGVYLAAQLYLHIEASRVVRVVNTHTEEDLSDVITVSTWEGFND